MGRRIEPAFRVPWHWIGFWSGLAFLLVGIGYGSLFALEGKDLGRFEKERRDRLETQCVAGNANACRIYEIDFQRGL